MRKGSQRLLRRNFFQQRPVRERHSAFKCFAAECIAAVDVLVLFFTMCLFPKGLLLQHGMCMQLLKSIMDIVFLNDRALKHVDKLDLLARGHQRLFLELYGVESTIPKNHHLFHISKSIRRFGTSLTCFKMERMHHTAKQLGEHGRGDSYQINITKRSALRMLFEEDPMAEFSLQEPISSDPGMRVAVSLLFPDVGTDVNTSKKMQTPIGNMMRGDIFLASTEPMEIYLANFFVRAVCLANLQHVHFVACQQYLQTHRHEWELCDRWQLLPCKNMLSSLVCFRSGDTTIVPLMPEFV